MTARSLSFNAGRCVGCGVCQLVCSAAWQKVFNPLRAKLRIEHTGWYGPFKAGICRQEEDAPCAKACPTGALHVDKVKGIVRFNKKKCDGCRLCLDACNYGGIFEDPAGHYILKCDLCGGGSRQLCIDACPRAALSVNEGGP